jgi:hypothetical protein
MWDRHCQLISLSGAQSIVCQIETFLAPSWSCFCLERLAVRQKWLWLANSNRKWLCEISWWERLRRSPQVSHLLTKRFSKFSRKKLDLLKKNIVAGISSLKWLSMFFFRVLYPITREACVYNYYKVVHNEYVTWQILWFSGIFSPGIFFRLIIYKELCKYKIDCFQISHLFKDRNYWITLKKTYDGLYSTWKV